MLLNIERARQLMMRDGLEALVLVEPKNVYYFSDYESDWLFDFPWVSCVVFAADPSRPPFLIVHDVELTTLAEKPSWIPETRVYMANVMGDSMAHYAVADKDQLTDLDRRTVQLMEHTSSTAGSGLLPVLLRVINETGLWDARVGFDDLRLAAAVRAANPTLSATDGANTVQRIRMVKTADEIVLMRHAASCNERALKAAIATCKPGALWSDVVRAYNVATVRQDCRPFALFVGAGHRSTGIRVHRDYEIERGDQICFDAMMTYQRYFADMQRTVVLGEPSSKLASYWAAVMEGATAAYDSMRPGVSTRLLRELALETVRKAGIPTFRHAFLHSLGLDHLELPAMYGGLVDFELEQGMMVNMDFEVCELGFGGVYFEETMLITSNGAERIATLPRELITL